MTKENNNKKNLDNEFDDFLKWVYAGSWCQTTQSEQQNPGRNRLIFLKGWEQTSAGLPLPGSKSLPGLRIQIYLKQQQKEPSTRWS